MILTVGSEVISQGGLLYQESGKADTRGIMGLDGRGDSHRALSGVDDILDQEDVLLEHDTI